jgi:hypothetical protein
LHPAIRFSSRTGLICWEGRAMFRVVTACAIALLLAAYCATPAPTQAPGGSEAELPALLKAEPVKADPQDDDLRKLLKERYNEAVAEMSERSRQMRAGSTTFDSCFVAAQRLVPAGLELSEKPADQVALLEKYVALAKQYERLLEDRLERGIRGFSKAELHQVKYARADAEIQLLRAKERAKADKK